MVLEITRGNSFKSLFWILESNRLNLNCPRCPRLQSTLWKSRFLPDVKILNTIIDVWIEVYSGVWLSFYTYYISPIEIGLLWARITYLKSPSKPWPLVSKQIWKLWFNLMRLGPVALADFFDLQLWPLISLQPLDQNQCLVPHMKVLFHIFLEIEGQGYCLTFKVCNLSSK